MKEKINFLPQMFTEGIYFFKDPETYNEEMLAKKLTPETLEILKQIDADYQSDLVFDKTVLEQNFHDHLEKNNKKPGDVMPLLRIATTGVAGGAPLFDLFELLGKETILRRLEKFINLKK